MDWLHPEFLYLILPLCVAWIVLALFSDRQRQRSRGTFALQPMWTRVFPIESRWRFWLKLVLREVAIVMGLVALAGPRFGVQFEQVIPRGADLYVLIDVSRSMLADDVPPSRLGRAKADVSALLNRLEGERVGLIAFAGQAVVKCPLTVDYDSFRRALDELDPDSAPRGGTAIGDAIRKGLEVFHTNAERDQAMLIITDGDDQQSYPLEAAAAANERHVTIFTIGLGDTEKGARVPSKGESKSFLEYKGEQVWSKLDSSLLEQIALKTSGVYIPAGTKAYDLGELYANHLQGRRGNDAVSQQKTRRSERFQIFLALAIAALLIDLSVPPYRRSSWSKPTSENPKGSSVATKRSNKPNANIGAVASIWTLVMLNTFAGNLVAEEPEAAVRDGLRLYAKDQFEEAREKFSAASEELEKRKSAAASVAAFDEACAAHRKGDTVRARECYLRAGLSLDRSIATSAHFNLGTIYAEKARTLCGEKPEAIAPDQCKEILDELSQAVAAYRHCLELQSDHVPARRNIELVRQWIKYYTDRWREIDRQKRRDESNLLQFLEFMSETQMGLRETVKRLPQTIHSDTFAELKRAQSELREEIPTLREKVDRELRPKPDPQAPQANTNAPKDQELEDGIKLLQSWVDTAGEKMSAAAQRLAAKDPTKAAADQQAAIEELDKIWEGVVPFQPLLAKELADQTAIATALSPYASAKNPDTENSASISEPEPSKEGTDEQEGKPSSSQSQPQWEIAEDDLPTLEEIQTRTLKRARLIAPKAQMELERLEAAPSAAAGSGQDANSPDDGGQSQPAPAVDPEQAKSGFRKAIELAPQAIEQMEAAAKSLKQKDRPKSAEHSEQARKILEEIQKAQPKPDQQQNQDKQDQQKNEDQKNDQQNKQDKQDQEQKKDEKEKDEQKSQDQKQDQQKQEQQQAQGSKDRIEDTLRKVRERQQEKRERDKKLKGTYLGRQPVDKDW